MTASTGSAASDATTLNFSESKIVDLLGRGEAQQLETAVIPEFLPRQRWFGAKDSTITGVKLLALGELETGKHALVAADVSFATETQRYLLPLSTNWDDGVSHPLQTSPVLAQLTNGDRTGVLIDSALDPRLASALLSGMQSGKSVDSEAGELLFEAGDGLASIGELEEPRALGAEQSNVSIAFGNKVILKLYRRLRAGDQPDVEVARFLTNTGHFANTPEFLGQIRHRPKQGENTTLAAAFAFVPNGGDAWAVITEALAQDLQEHGSQSADGSDSSTHEAVFEDKLLIGGLLGQRTAELHKALAAQTDDQAFAVEPLRSETVQAWSSEAIAEALTVLNQLQELVPSLPAGAQQLASEVLNQRDRVIERLQASAGMAPSGGQSRIHGDYHLGQVLATADDFMIIDFEGEPRRTLKERQAKSSPLRDVAGMLRSFHYAAWTALDRYQRLNGTSDVRGRAEAWRRSVSDDFVRTYQEHIAGAPNYPQDPKFAHALTEMFLLQKAIYEVGYEMANRPDWVEIPLSGMRDLLHENQSGGPTYE